MLDDFAAVTVEPKKPDAPAGPAPPPAAGAGVSANDNDEPALSEEDFAKELQAGMADLLGELDQSVSGKVTLRAYAPNHTIAGDAGTVREHIQGARRCGINERRASLDSPEPATAHQQRLDHRPR